MYYLGRWCCWWCWTHSGECMQTTWEGGVAGGVGVGHTVALVLSVSAVGSPITRGQHGDEPQRAMAEVILLGDQSLKNYKQRERDVNQRQIVHDHIVKVFQSHGTVQVNPFALCRAWKLPHRPPPLQDYRFLIFRVYNIVVPFLEY